MEIITYLKKIPTFKKVLGFIICAFGLYAFVFSSIAFGIMSFLIGLNLFLTEGSQINLENNTYRNIKSLFGLNFGTWKPCPEFEYVSVFKTKENQTVRVVSAEATLQNDVILLNLFYKGNKHITFYKTQDKSDAFKMAEKFKFIFGVDILDATGTEKVWL